MDSERQCAIKSVEKNADDIPDVLARIDVLTDYFRIHQADFQDFNYIEREICNLIIRGIDEVSFFMKNTAWKCPSTNFGPPHMVNLT